MKLPWTRRSGVDKTALVDSTFDALETAPCTWTGRGDIINQGEVSCELKGVPVTIAWGYSDGPERMEWATLATRADREPVNVDLTRNDLARARVVASRALQQIRSTSVR